VKVQRREFAKGSFSAERQARLEELPSWSWDPFTDRWGEGFRHLEDYVAQNGNARVPRSYVTEGFRLGAWVKKQRGVFGRGLLDPQRRRRLEEMPGWTWDPFADQWEEGFRRLVDWVKVRGDALLPRNYIVDGFNVGSWVRTCNVSSTRVVALTLSADEGWKNSLAGSGKTSATSGRRVFNSCSLMWLSTLMPVSPAGW
jgi:hypothetical protein